ncbi:hypothetical protein L1987_81517 [Smallanthus sonchifolius]|uniref:Uncharacterized protein n=1 Tax=Smallanthus sonchifolius TaxID=185202 RepID=A0ACB8YR35_9ASTR|nr:hypothetical protein L1987_81517 [Smallanthus sonchifolius]
MASSLNLSSSSIQNPKNTFPQPSPTHLFPKTLKLKQLHNKSITCSSLPILTPQPHIQDSQKDEKFPIFIEDNRPLHQIWQEIQGSNNWTGLLDPMNSHLRREIIRYGEFAQACYDSFDFDPRSKYCGTCKYQGAHFFENLAVSADENVAWRASEPHSLCYGGRGLGFGSATGRDIALVNKSCDFLKECGVPAYWRQDENKGMVRGGDGRWVLPERPRLDSHPPDTAYYLEQVLKFAANSTLKAL